jgi:putative transposase
LRSKGSTKGYVDHDNDIRLSSAIGYITPKNMLARHQQEIQADRDRKLEAAADSGRCRSAFRDDADHYSVLIPISIPL